MKDECPVCKVECPVCYEEFSDNDLKCGRCDKATCVKCVARLVKKTVSVTEEMRVAREAWMRARAEWMAAEMVAEMAADAAEAAMETVAEEAWRVEEGEGASEAWETVSASYLEALEIRLVAAKVEARAAAARVREVVARNATRAAAGGGGQRGVAGAMAVMVAARSVRFCWKCPMCRSMREVNRAQLQLLGLT